jgi:hypothetical protein
MTIFGLPYKNQNLSLSLKMPMFSPSQKPGIPGDKQSQHWAESCSKTQANMSGYSKKLTVIGKQESIQKDTNYCGDSWQKRHVRDTQKTHS